LQAVRVNDMQQSQGGWKMEGGVDEKRGEGQGGIGLRVAYHPHARVRYPHVHAFVPAVEIKVGCVFANTHSTRGLATYIGRDT
jgi:hypothetical protein